MPVMPAWLSFPLKYSGGAKLLTLCIVLIWLTLKGYTYCNSPVSAWVIRNTSSFKSFSKISHDKNYIKSKKKSNDQELIQSVPTSCLQNQKGNN